MLSMMRASGCSVGSFTVGSGSVDINDGALFPLLKGQRLRGVGVRVRSIDPEVAYLNFDFRIIDKPVHSTVGMLISNGIFGLSRSLVLPSLSTANRFWTEWLLEVALTSPLGVITSRTAVGEFWYPMNFIPEESCAIALGFGVNTGNGDTAWSISCNLDVAQVLDLGPF